MEKKTADKKAKEPVSSEKLKALNNAMAKIEKDFGRGTIMKLGDDNIEDIEVIPSGIIGLDYALGVGGYPRGRIIEIYGPESSGKTTLATLAIAQAQKQGGIAAIIDAEHAFDRFYAEKLGVDVNNLWIAQPDNGEQASKLPTNSSARRLSTSSSSTQLPLLLPRLKSKVLWATSKWVCRLDSCRKPSANLQALFRKRKQPVYSSTNCATKSA